MYRPIFVMGWRVAAFWVRISLWYSNELLWIMREMYAVFNMNYAVVIIFLKVSK
jgi:hypothetical protein